MMGNDRKNEEGPSVDPIAMMLDMKKELESMKWKNAEEIEAL